MERSDGRTDQGSPLAAGGVIRNRGECGRHNQTSTADCRPLHRMVRPMIVRITMVMDNHGSFCIEKAQVLDT